MKYMRPPEPYFGAGKLCLRYDKPEDEAKFLIDIYPYLDLNKYVGWKTDSESLSRICADLFSEIRDLMFAAGYRW